MKIGGDSNFNKTHSEPFFDKKKNIVQKRLEDKSDSEDIDKIPDEKPEEGSKGC